MDAAACAALEPSLEPLGPNLAGGSFFPHDESGDACKFSQERAAACRQLGVSFRFGTSVIRILASHQRVAGVETDRGRFEADHYVLATGCASTAPARAIGIDLPICPVKGYSVTVATEGRVGMPVRPLTDWEPKHCITHLSIGRG